MGYEMKLIRNFSRFEPQKLGVALFVGCFLFSMTFVSVSKLVGFRPMNPVQSIPVTEDSDSSQSSGIELKADMRIQKNSLISLASSDEQQKDGIYSKQPNVINKKVMPETNPSDRIEQKMMPETKASDVMNQKVMPDMKPSEVVNLKMMPEMRPLCDFSDRRSDVCEMEGDIRIHGNSSCILFVNPSNRATPQRNESWFIKPHPRKGDLTALNHVRQMSVKSLPNYDDEAFPCDVNHSVPAVVFSTGGYMGNIFHDFTDILIPLFVTSRHYQGEVQFLISESHSWWLSKYRPYLKELSHYEVIDFNKETRVHCFPHATIGLRSLKEMSIDPLRAPNGYSMVDFARLMRKAYSLGRESAIKLGAIQSKKPRLLIIARKWTRSFKNVDEIVLMAEGLGYEVVVAEAHTGSNLAQFSKIVNSCDVMMGVHGAGLTNLVFLPTNATVIQVVPLGRLERISWLDFGQPSLDRKLRYLQYNITEEESTLIEMYPRDHAVFKDPTSIGRQGWLALRAVYLVKQSVRLDLRRFKGYLEQALQLLHE